MSDEKVEMAALKMPKEHMGFIKSNPKIAQSVGKLMVILHDMKKSITSIESLLNKSEVFEEIMENGTKEELLGFLNACKKIANDTEGMVHIKDISKDIFDKLKEKFKEHMVKIKIESTS